MKIIKFLIGIVLFFVVVVLAINLVGGQVLASSLSDVMGAPVKVRNLSLNVFKQQLGIYGIKIKNTEGFEEDAMLKIPEVYVDLNLATIFTGKIVAEEIRLNLEHVTLERNRAGKYNLLDLKPLKKGEESPSEDEKPTEKPDTKPKKEKKPGFFSVRIDQVLLNVGKARYVDYSKPEVATKEFDIGIKNTKLSNIETVQDLVREVIQAVMKRALIKAMLPDMEKVSAALGEKMDEMKEGFGSFVDKVKDSIKKE